MRKSTKSILVLTAIFVFSVMAFTFAAWLSNGYESLAALYLKVDNKVVVNTIDLAAQGQTVAVQVKAAKYSKQADKYTVLITPNSENDLSYIVDGEFHRFSEITNLNSAFNVETKDKIIYLKCVSILQLLTNYHDGKKVELISETYNDVSYFILTVSSKNGPNVITVNLRYHVSLEGFDIPEEVIFG